MINSKDVLAKFELELNSNDLCEVFDIYFLDQIKSLSKDITVCDNTLKVTGFYDNVHIIRGKVVDYLYKNYNIVVDTPDIYLTSNTFIDDLNEATDFEDEQKEKFIHNFGVLLSQTREKVESLSYDRTTSNQEFVTIHYKKTDFTKKVNISCNSWATIIRDVTKVVS